MQKTAYEMRISDWSSDVCSSDLTSSIQLVAPDAQLDWDPATEAQLRAILTELVKPGAPPRITGIANGFHVPGTLPGEGETQLFLDTATGDPVSLTITTSADGSRRWSAAFGEIVDGAGVPKRHTLAWYRLACRSEERRVGKEGGGTCSSRWSPYP